MKFRYLVLVCIVLVGISLVVGPEQLTMVDGKLDEMSRIVLWHSRIPRTVSIVLVGSSMSVAGLLMQTATQNRFAAPSTIGTIEAAKLGLLLSIWLIPNVTLQQKMWSAFGAAIVLTAIFFQLIRVIRIQRAWMLPLFGMMFSQLIGSLGEAIAFRFDLVQSMSSWQQGNFALMQTNQYEWLFVVVIVIGMMYWLNERLSLLQLGKATAQSIGLPYEWLQRFVLVAVSLICAVNVITVGIFPFIGIVVPNIVRLYKGDLLKESMPFVAVVGACFILVCDLIARSVIMPYEIPISVVVALVGGSLFLLLLWKGGMKGAT